MKYVEIQAKTALHRLKKDCRLPYNYDLNIYRGCSHQCQYCYAMYSHKYLETSDFFDQIFVKTNVAQMLDKELSSPRSKIRGKEIINLGGVCDSYQVGEAHYQLMPRVLEILIKHRQPTIISTKSELILRDLDLLKQLSKVAYLGIAVTITTMDNQIQKKIEPRVVEAKRRFEILKVLKTTKARVGLHIMPVLPFLTDSKENLESLFEQGEKVHADYILAGMLNLIGETKKHFLGFIEKEFPDLYPFYLKLYNSKEVGGRYRKNTYALINDLRKKYGFEKRIPRPITGQMSLI